MLVELVEVKIAQFVVTDLVGEHVIDGHLDLLGHGYDCRLYPRRAQRSFYQLEPNPMCVFRFGRRRETEPLPAIGETCRGTIAEDICRRDGLP
jgi:hypothetical protein